MVKGEKKIQIDVFAPEKGTWQGLGNRAFLVYMRCLTGEPWTRESPESKVRELRKVKIEFFINPN